MENDKNTDDIQKFVAEVGRGDNAKANKRLEKILKAKTAKRINKVLGN